MSIHADITAEVGEFTLRVDLTAETKSCVAVVGPNGAGKSTLVNILAGLIPLQSGQITLAGLITDDPAQKIRVPPNRRPIALHSQANLLFPHLSVLENVAFGLRCHGLNKPEAHRQALGWLDRVGLADMASRRPAQLSGGQAQRVGLVRAMACDPEVLLFDESLAALDTEVRTEVRHVLADSSRTRLLVTHDPVEARVLADQLVVLEAGRVTQTGSPEAVAANPRTKWTAELLGTNLLAGHAHQTGVTLDSGFTLTTVTAMSGPVLVTFPPSAVTLSATQPHTSARNTWEAAVTSLQPDGDRVRVSLGSPVPCRVWVTPQAVKELELDNNSQCWASLKATELAVQKA